MNSRVDFRGALTGGLCHFLCKNQGLWIMGEFYSE